MIASELSLERQIREDTIRELSRRSSHEVAELRESVRQLREDNQNMKLTVQGLEGLVRRQRTASPYGIEGDGGMTSPGRGGEGSSIALLPRVADLEAVVQRQQRLIEERGLRWDQSITEAISTRVEAEAEKMRTVAREAARDATDAYVALRTDAMKEQFESHIKQAENGYQRASEAARTVDAMLQNSRRQTEGQIARLEERVDSALEGKDKWMRVSTDVHETVRLQLEQERTRMEDQLQHLRAEVANASKRQSEESLDAQHALQHFVNQRLEALSAQTMRRDEAIKLLSSATTQMEDEASSMRRVLQAYKTQSDDGRVELNKFLQESEARLASIRAAVDELSVTRQADSDNVSRVRASVDEISHKLQQTSLRVEGNIEKHMALASQFDQMDNASKDYQRASKHVFDRFDANLEHVKKTALEHATEVAKVSNVAHRLEHTQTAQREEIASQQKRIEALPQEMTSMVKKLIQVAISESEATLTAQIEAVAIERSASKETQWTAASERNAVVEEIASIVASKLTSVQDERIAKSIAASTSAITVDVMGRVDDQLATFQQQQNNRLTSLSEQSKRTVDNATNAVKSDLEHLLEAKLDGLTTKSLRDLHAAVKDVTTTLRGDIKSAVDEQRAHTVTQIEAVVGTVRSLQQHQVDVERSNERVKEIIAVEVANMKHATVKECQVALADVRATLEAQWNSRLDAQNHRVEHLATMVKESSGLATSSARSASGAGTLSAHQELIEGDIVHRVRQQVLIDVDQKLQDVAVQNTRRLQEVSSLSSQAVARVQSLVNDVDDRLTSLALSSENPAKHQSGQAPGTSSSASALQQRQWLHDAEQRLKKEWQTQLSSLASEVNQGIVELQEQLDERITAVVNAQSAASLPQRGGVTPSPHRGGSVSDDIMEQVEARVTHTLQGAINDLDRQTEESLEALDGKLNALAEAFSNREDEKDAKLQQCVHSCFATLRDASSNASSSLHTTMATNPTDGSVHQHHNTSTATFSEHPSSSNQRVDIYQLLPMLTTKVIQCSEALQAISTSVLDTVDLVQRHEVGFASVSELVQAIVFNSQNIVTLAEAVGLDKDAFALRLNYTELGGPQYDEGDNEH
jgi:hypothetical protein